MPTQPIQSKAKSTEAQLSKTRMTESPLKNLAQRQSSCFSTPIQLRNSPLERHAYILLINRSLLTGLPFLPALVLGISVHISFTFSNTILQCLSKAFTRASSFRLLRQEISTWVCDRTAVWRMERGPDVNSCSSSCAISNSLEKVSYVLWLEERRYT
jgi:hypothetical protein